MVPWYIYVKCGRSFVLEFVWCHVHTWYWYDLVLNIVCLKYIALSCDLYQVGFSVEFYLPRN